jgi:2-C-methyl-D-erythritol 4-phosphate cytidylyltransferase
MGFDKLLTPLVRQPLLCHTLERLQRAPEVGEIVLVVRPDAEELVEGLIAAARERGRVRLVHGGAERQDSVMAGLKAVSPEFDYVLIQDAARPFITPELVEKVYLAAQETGAAVSGAPTSDSLKEVGSDGLVVQTIDRAKIWAVQTPQIFRTKLLLDAYRQVVSDGLAVTDDTAAVERAGGQVRVVLHHGMNLKVTTPADWKLAEAYLTCGEADSAIGQELRRLLHDINNHLTPLLGYAFLVGNELPEDAKGRKYAENIGLAGEKCHKVVQQVQQIVRAIFPRREENRSKPE